jgi:hypothetical protein
MSRTCFTPFCKVGLATYSGIVKVALDHEAEALRVVNWQYSCAAFHGCKLPLNRESGKLF